jgi:hypothetical protein
VLVAIAGMPDRPEARAQAAAATGLALADLNRRLAGTLPRVLFPGLPDEKVAPAVDALERLGFAVLVADPAVVPGDDERIIARRIELSAGAVSVTDAKGVDHRCPASAIDLLQRGVRVTASTENVTTSERKLAVGRAILSGGLMMTRKTEKTTVKTTESAEPFLLVQRGDGQPDIVVYERRIDYRSLGAQMQPASRANLELVWAHLRALAPAAVDDRVGRPGFVTGLPATSADPVDLALFLVALARRSQ